MRIGLLVPGFSAHAADWCIPALRHLVRCLAVNDDVRIVSVRYPYQRARYAIEAAEVFAVGGAQRSGLSTLELWRDTLRLLRTEHRRRPFDVLHAFWATESGLLAAIAGRVLHVPAIVSLAGGELIALRDINYGDQRVAWERLKVGTSLRLAKRVTAGSQQLIDLASKHVKASKLHRAPLGVDTRLFNPPDECVHQPQRRVVSVGALVPVKDHAMLLRAFGQLKDVSVRLEIVGEGPLRAELESLASALGIAERVCFRGEVDHAALPMVYRGAAACVVASRHEAQCMAALEAAACGVRVVGTRVGLLPELTSALIPTGDFDGLAATLANALATDSRVERVPTEFSLEACTARFRRLYATLA